MAPSNPRPTPDHPPYGEMISSAIIALNEDGGSTAASIDAFIREKYKGEQLPQAHSNLFPYHLSKLLHLGEIRQSATHLYIVAPEEDNSPSPCPNPKPSPPATLSSPSDTPTPPEPPVEKLKRRGRPPKPKPMPDTEQHQQAASAATEGCEDVPRRRRGRPPKRPKDEKMMSSSAL